MNLEWADDRCMLCALTLTERCRRRSETAMLTEEHLIPAAIGGRLTCHFLCKHCNDLLGRTEARLKEDSRIRLAIDNLKDLLPDLWATMAENQACFAKGQYGKTIAGRIKKGTFSVNSSSRPDGSLVQSFPAATKTVRRMLQKCGAAQDEISDAETRLKELPEGIRVRVANTIEVIKSPVDAVCPVLNSRGIEPQVLIKIAYEYLGLHLGGNIFHQYFDPIRAFLAGGAAPSCCSLQERRVRDRKYQPYHGLAVSKTTNGTVVKIRLFGYLSYPVVFHGVQVVSGTSYCYTLHLDTQEEEWVEFEPEST